MKCYNHSDIDAVGVCTSCGKAICSQCSITVNKKLICKSCATDIISKKSSSAGLFGDIVYYLDVIIGAVIVCALFIGFIILLLLALFPAAVVCLLITLVGAYGLYKDIKRDRKNTAYNVFTIVIYVIIFLIVVITIGVISTMVI